MKKLVKRILLILLAVMIAVQAPFIYRRYKIGQLSVKIGEMERSRAAGSQPVLGKLVEYKGIIHAHTNLGGHSTGSFDELIAAANANDLDFVVMTEHWSETVDTAALTLNGFYGKTLFVGGNEIDTAVAGDRFLMIPGSAEAAGLRKVPTPAVIDKLHAENRLALVTYPEKLSSWDAAFDGVEVFSLHTNAKRMNPFSAVFDAIWSFPTYPELMLATHFKRPSENLKKFDELAASRKVSLFAGTDAHSNIGFHLVGDDAGNKLVNLKVDDYATIFRLVRQHVFVEVDKPLAQESLIEALKEGRSFIGFDSIGNTSGFAFFGETGQGPGFMGHTISRGHNLWLKAVSPLAARFTLFKDGVVVATSAIATEFSFKPEESGSYRVEVHLDQLGPPFDKMPWIISNPIYVR